MEMSSVTYQDLVREIWRVPSTDLGLALDFLKFLRLRHTQTQTTLKVERDLPDGASIWVARNGMEIVTLPATSLQKMIDIFDLSGDALEDSERLYDGID